MSQAEKPKGGFDSAAFLRTLTSRPGVYRMLDEKGAILYVGKARNLKKRVSSYFRPGNPSPKVQALVAQIRAIEVTVTHTEGEALLLENNLIKAHRPRYNVVLRDDKSYPYIFLSGESDFPRLGFHRGPQREQGRYFGPYPSAGAVRETLQLLQKLFPVRQCEDSFYRNRSRPCLQYQIKRCTAPCVGLVTPATYAEDVRHAVMFLEGRSNTVAEELAERMETAAAALEFEQAARLRDQITSLRRVQERQYVSGGGGDADIVAVAARAGMACVQVLFVRGGRLLGSKDFFPRAPEGVEAREILQAFLPQFYLNARHAADIPGEILIEAGFDASELLEEVLGTEAGHRVRLLHRLRGERARWVVLARTNAEQALASRLASRQDVYRRFEALQDALDLDALPQRLECFDISHTMGEATVASCVVFDRNGPLKSDYRRFNISGITPGDDYAAMQQALSRRYTRLKSGEGKLPDVLFIDGGRGQVAEALKVIEELQVEGVIVVGVAKGPSRKAGLERLVVGGREFTLRADSPALHLIQQIRDEAHRFAITGHRQQRARKRSRSPLETVEGVGPKRRRGLLRHFGGLQGIARAGVEDLARVPGISRALAQRLYDAFHNES